MTKSLKCICLILLWLPSLCGADIYQWIDANGVKHFSNSPPGEGIASQTPEIYSSTEDAEPPRKHEPDGNEDSRPQETGSEPRVNIEFKYYDISGVDIADFRNESIKHSPIHQDGRTFCGYTQWHIMPYNRVRQSNGVWYYDEVSATVDITYTMPRWIDYYRADQARQKRWDDFYNWLLDHEQGHKDIAVAAARKLCRTFIRLESRLGETALKKLGNAKAGEIYQECRSLNAQFDIETEHGRKK